jgi:predicted ATPase
MSQHVESKLQMTASGQKRQNTSELVYMLRILQEASLIGTWFSSRMLASANRKPIDIAEINCALDQLEDCDLIEMVYNEHTNGERYYRFNHQLAQQTLY